jgi:hypothetical protein
MMVFDNDQARYSVTDFAGNSAEAIRMARVTTGTEISDYAVSWDSRFSLLPQDVNGWSILDPAPAFVLVCPYIDML